VPGYWASGPEDDVVTLSVAVQASLPALAQLFVIRARSKVRAKEFRFFSRTFEPDKKGDDAYSILLAI
jgi:hypothetical protein